MRWRRVRTLSAYLRTPSGRRTGDVAAECAFFVALAILPMMLTTTGLLRALRPTLGQDASPQIERGLTQLLRIVLTSRGGTAADAASHLLAQGNGGLLTAGTLVSVFVVTRAMRSIITGLHSARSRPDQDYSTSRLWLTSLGLAVVGVVVGALTLAMIAAGPLLGHTKDISPGAAGVVAGIWYVLRWPVAVLVLVGYVLLVHRAGLRRSEGHRPRRAALVGAAVTTVGAAAASALLPVYVHLAGLISPTTGALGGGLILLLWAYLIMLALLIGAQVRVAIDTQATASDATGTRTPGRGPDRTGAGVR